MPRGVYTRKPRVKNHLMIPIIKTTLVQPESLKSIDFDKLVGLKASLYYNTNTNMFQLGDVLFEVQEDPQDGYRSCMSQVVILTQNRLRNPGEYLGGVIIKKENDNDFQGFSLRDEVDDYEWIRFGTANAGDYYPSFCFNYNPRPERKNIQEVLEEDIKSQIL